MQEVKITDSQIMAILKEAELGLKVSDLCRKHGMSDVTFYGWRAKYGGMDTSMIKRMNELQAGDRGDQNAGANYRVARQAESHSL